MTIGEKIVYGLVILTLVFTGVLLGCAAGSVPSHPAGTYQLIELKDGSVWVYDTSTGEARNVKVPDKAKTLNELPNLKTRQF